MLSKEELIQNLIHEIRNDIKLGYELIDLLEQEKLTLEQKDINKLEIISKKKAEIISSLTKNQITRDSIQEKLGASIGLKGLQTILKKFVLKNHEIFKHIIDELEQLLSKVKYMMDVNSKIVAISQAQTSRVLDIICGRENTSYSKKTQICSTNTSKTITKA